MVEIHNITENEDGSADIEMTLTAEVLQMLLNEGFNKVLKEHCERVIAEGEE